MCGSKNKIEKFSLKGNGWKILKFQPKSNESFHGIGVDNTNRRLSSV